MKQYAIALTALGAVALAAGCGSPGGATRSAALALPNAHAAAVTGPIAASPQPLDFTLPNVKQSFTVTDPNFTGVFKTSVPKSCKKVAKLSGSPAGPNGTFDVVSIKAGRCDVTISDSKGQSLVETIHVTITKGTIN